MRSKTCTKCSALKPLKAFHRNRSQPDGRMSQCAECRRATYRAAHPVPPPEKPGHKRCARCTQLLPLEDFTPRKDSRTGRASWCRKCAREHSRDKAKIPHAHMDEIARPE